MAPVEPLHPDPRQRVVLDHADGAMLVSGGSGTGKTAVLRERFARLVEGGADPERVALVVGSRRARDEARRLLLERLPVALPNLTVVTIHGLAFHVVGQRFERLGYATPPTVLSASEQFLRVRELLDGEDPERWPVFGSLLGLRGFADEVRQLVIRAQEALRSPDDIEREAAERGLAGWDELAAFLRHYLSVLDASSEVDFAGLVEQAAVAAGAGDPPFDHVMVDDYQDTTFAAERFLAEIRPRSFVAAGDLDAHLFSFQGTTDEPFRRFVERNPGAASVELETPHRPEPVSTEAWRAGHVSEQHAAVARELRRLHVDDGVAWRELAVVVRRHGPHVEGLLRALDDAHVPRRIADAGSPAAVPATRPFVLALRWLVAGPQERDALIEPVLTSELGRLSPASVRTLLRLARAHGRPPREALALHDLAEPEDAEALRALARRPRTGRGRSRLGARRVPPALARAPVRGRPGGAGRDRPPRARRPRRGGRVLGRRRVRGHGGRPVDRGLPALARRGGGCAEPRGGRRGRPRRGAGADGARGRRSGVRHGDRARCARGRLPEPVPARADVRSRDARGRDRAFRGQPATARRRAPPVRDGPLARAAPGGADRDGSARRRVLGHADLAVRRGARSAVARRSGRAVRGAGVDVRGGLGVAARARRPERAGGRAARWPGRAARARGRPRFVVVPARVDRPVRGGGGRPLAVVLAAVDARELRAAVRAVQRARAGSGRRLPGLGGQARALDHRGVRARRGRAHARGVRTRAGRAVGEDPVPVVRDLRGRARERQGGPDPELVRTLRGAAGDGDRARVRVRVRGRSDPRQDRPDRPGARGRHADHRLQDRAFGQRPQTRREPAARHLLPGGQRGRRAGRAPAGAGGRARVPRREEGGSRARRQGMVGLRGRRGGLPGADARAARRADRPQPRAQRGARSTVPTRRRTASSATSRRSARCYPQGGAVFPVEAPATAPAEVGAGS